MFGLFEKKTGSDQFAKDITKAFGSLVQKIFKEYGKDNMVGTMAMMAFENAVKGWKDKSSKFSMDYKISEAQVKNIIDKSSSEVFNKYFK